MPVTDNCTIDGEIVSETRNGTERDYVPDPLGSTVALLDGTQTKTDTYTYWPYGEIRTSTGTNATPFKFVGTLGYFRDSSTRTYVRARTYQQGYGRWMTVDPMWPNSPAFEYSACNSTTWVDPQGLQGLPKRALTWREHWSDSSVRMQELFLKQCKERARIRRDNCLSYGDTGCNILEYMLLSISVATIPATVGLSLTSQLCIAGGTGIGTIELMNHLSNGVQKECLDIYDRDLAECDRCRLDPRGYISTPRSRCKGMAIADCAYTGRHPYFYQSCFDAHFKACLSKFGLTP